MWIGISESECCRKASFAMCPPSVGTSWKVWLAGRPSCFGRAVECFAHLTTTVLIRHQMSTHCSDMDLKFHAFDVPCCVNWHGTGLKGLDVGRGFMEPFNGSC